MSGTKRALGRGLGALLNVSSGFNADPSQILDIDLTKIIPNPFQPRRSFLPESIQELADSIDRGQLLQPICVRKNHERYEIVNGERRFRAFQKLDRKTIPCIITEFTDKEMLLNALIENVQREDLNPIDEALSYSRMTQEFCLTHEELALNLGKSRSHITNSLRLLKLPRPVLEYIESGFLAPGGARALLALKDPDLQKRIASEAIVQGSNVRQIEQTVKDVLKPNSSTEHNSPESFDHLEGKYQQCFEALLKVNCQVKVSSSACRVQLRFKNQSEVDDFLKQLEAQLN
jgi:ParB family transcriptional regulator, chromosome partitioning protein